MGKLRLLKGHKLAALSLLLVSSNCTREVEYSAATLEPDGSYSTETAGNAVDEAVYQAGSVAKYACTILVLRFVDQRKLDLDQTLASIFPGEALGEAGRVTVADLLANRSGLRDGLTPAIEEDMSVVMEMSDPLSASMTFAAGDLSANPGAEYSYDLVNWIAVQAVLEQVGKRPIEDLLTADVLKEAGMQSSYIFDRELGFDAQPPVSDAMPMPDFLKCAGGLAARPRDLVALLRFVHNGGLSRDMRATLMQVRTPEENYSLGGRFERIEGRLIDWKTGSNGPYKSVVVYDPESDQGFAAMTATDDWTTIERLRGEWLADLVEPRQDGTNIKR